MPNTVGINICILYKVVDFFILFQHTYHYVRGKVVVDVFGINHIVWLSVF